MTREEIDEQFRETQTEISELEDQLKSAYAQLDRLAGMQPDTKSAE